MKIIIFKILLFAPIILNARDYSIFSISHELPMKNDLAPIKKNLYINMGSNQGVSKGAVLNVFRTISVQDPYSDKKRFDHKVKIAEIKVIHSEQQSSIARIVKLEESEDTPIFEIEAPMIGDRVDVKIAN